MKIFLRSRKGSYIVFITLVFSSVLIMTTAVLHAAGQRAIDSTVQHFGRLWGRSILAEYDRTLKERYGFFGFYGNEFEVEKKLDFYASYTFDEKKYIRYKDSVCSLKGKAITEPDNFKKQIKEIAASGVNPRPIRKNSQEAAASAGDRSINSQRITAGLPSGGRRGGPGIKGLIDLMKEGKPVSALVSQSAQNIYAFRFFSHRFSDKDFGDSFFRCELEYIISGKTDEGKAKKSVGNDLILLRNGMNLIYLYSCDEKRGAAAAAAQAATPGPAAVVTQALIMETWALLEAQNDLKILEDNKPVRFMKYDENWAVSLENVISVLFDDESGDGESPGYIRPESMDGMEYEEYLRILLSAVPEETRILRMMDIIQINMKYLYCGSFLLKDYYTGLEFSFGVNGRTYEFKEDY